MASKAKNQKQASNILYLQDADAKALGIVEGSTQKVFVDNREVEVIFVDEHEVIPVSNEEKKLYAEAYKIASKYADLSKEGETPTSTSLVAKTDGKHKEKETKVKNKEPKEPNQFLNNVKGNFTKGWNSFVGLFKKSEKSEEEKEAKKAAKAAKAEKANSRELAVVSKEDKRKQEKEYEASRLEQKRHAKHSIRNDVFTEEELEIIQTVIDRSKNTSSVKSNKNAKSKK